MPKQRITQEAILEAAFPLLREQGYENINARGVAKRIGCSVQPIYSYFDNMDALMARLYEQTCKFLDEYVETYADKRQYFEEIGKCHVLFARDEKHLFRFLFLSPYMRAASFEDVYRAHARVDVAKSIQSSLGLSPADADELYMHMMLYTHGIACMIATGAADLPERDIHEKACFACKAFYLQLRKETPCD